MSAFTSILIITAAMIGIAGIILMVAAFANYLDMESDEGNFEHAVRFWHSGLICVCSCVVLMIVLTVPIILDNHPFIKN